MNPNDYSTTIIGLSNKTERTEGRSSHRRRGDRRSGRNVNRKSLSERRVTSTDSLDSTSSETSTASAISFESSPDRFFQELSSLVDLDSPSPVSHGDVDLAVNRVQSRLLDKHIKAGRLVSAVSTIDVVRPGAASGSRRDHLGGHANQRRIRTTLSFARNPHQIGLPGTSASNAMVNNPDVEIIVQGNESFNGTVANPSLRRQESNASAAAAGRAILRR